MSAIDVDLFPVEPTVHPHDKALLEWQEKHGVSAYKGNPPKCKCTSEEACECCELTWLSCTPGGRFRASGKTKEAACWAVGQKLKVPHWLEAHARKGI